MPLTHHHLARPLITALHDIEPLGEIYRDALISVQTNHLNELARNRIDIESGVTVACRKDDATLSPLCCGTGRCGLNALGQEVVGHWDGLSHSHCQQAYQYVKDALHLTSSFYFNLQNYNFFLKNKSFYQFILQPLSSFRLTSPPKSYIPPSEKKTGINQILWINLK